MKMRLRIGVRFKSYILVTLKSLGFLIGLAASILFFFNFIGLLIGAVYYIIFRGFWRLSGLVMMFAAALAANAPYRGFVEITGIYPLYLVSMVVGIIAGLFLILFMIFTLLSRRGVLDNLKERLSGIGHAYTGNKLLRIAVLTILLVIPFSLWASVNINLSVMFDNKPAMLWVKAPSVVAPGDEFQVHVQCWDRFERVSAVYQGTVQFSLESYDIDTQNLLVSVDASLPSDYTFTGSSHSSDQAYMRDNDQDNGRHSFQAVIATPGIHYIKAHDSETDTVYYSNPVIVDENTSYIYWGDIHTHSIYSDGSGTPSHNLYYARHVAMLDYFALTDHGEILYVSKLLGSNWLSKYTSAINAANIPSKFVTFLGVEYTNHSTGHYTCIFDGDQLPTDPIPRFRLPIIGSGLDTPNELWEVLDEFTEMTDARALALPHHTVQESFIQDWTYYNPKYVKIAEVTSNHGACLYEPSHPLSYLGTQAAPPPGTRGCSITDALKMGLQLSLYASSDTHDGHPGHTIAHTGADVGHQRPFTFWWTRFDKPYPVGLTAVYADELSRDAVFSALENRNIYANSDHGRPVLTFSVNGVEVGGNSTIRVAAADTPRELSIFLAQCGSPASTKNTAASVNASWQPNWNADIEILKNGDLLTTIEASEPVSAVTFVDQNPVTGTAFSEEDCVLIDGEYYINNFSNIPVNPQTLNTSGKDFYVVRIVGENHRHSYIGPIWVEVE